MADPLTLTAVSMGASALGGATSAVGKFMGGQSQSSMFKYQQGVARINKEIAEQNAAYARHVGEHEAQRSGMKTRFERSQTIATQSGRGLIVGQGSAGDVVESIGKIGQQEQTTIRANAARRAYGFEVEAAKQETAATMYGRSAKNARMAGVIDTVGSLLGSAASVSGKWLQASQGGVFGGQQLPALSPDFPHEFELA